jgi:hypothetical protein
VLFPKLNTDPHLELDVNITFVLKKPTDSFWTQDPKPSDISGLANSKPQEGHIIGKPRPKAAPVYKFIEKGAWLN